MPKDILSHLKIINTQISRHFKIKYHVLADQKKMSMSLRGQPTEKSPMGVCRASLQNEEWDLISNYQTGDLIMFPEYNVIPEGPTKIKSVNFISTSKGLISIKIKNGQFVKHLYTKSINEDRHYKFTDEECLDLPDDITDVYVQ